MSKARADEPSPVEELLLLLEPEQAGKERPSLEANLELPQGHSLRIADPPQA